MTAALGALALLFACCSLLLWQRLRSTAPGQQAVSGDIDVQREHFALAHRFTNDAVLLIDTERRILDANDRAVELYGYSGEELCGKRVDELRPPFDGLADVVADKFRQVTEQGRVLFETEHRHRDGRAFPVEVSARRLDLGGRTYVQSFVRDISERRRTEQALRDSERRFREFVEKASDVVYGLTADGRFTYITPNIGDMLGVEPSKLIGQPFDVVVHPEDRDELHQTFRRVGTPDDRRMTAEYRVVARDGSIYWHSARVSALLAPDGSIRAYAGISRDVTDRRLAELNLQQSERRLRDAQRIGHIGSWEADPYARRMIWSEETYRLFGVTHDQFDGTLESFLGLVHPDDRADMVHRIQDKDLGAQIGEDVFRRVLPDGTIRFLSGRGTAVRDDTGRVVAVIGTVQDITERKQIEAELRANEARYRNLFEQASDGLFLIGPDHRFVDINPAGLRQLGYTREELIGKQVQDILSPPERQRLLDEDGPTLRGTAQRAQWEHRRKDGSCFMAEVTSSAIDDSQRLAIVRDQSEAIAAQRELEHQRNLYDLLAKCNEAIVHTSDRRQLVQTAAKLAVEHGKFVFAYFGEVQPDGTVAPVAKFGEDADYVETLQISVIEGRPGSNGPTARSIRESRPVVVQDFLAESMTMPWHDAALQAGIGSSGSFPVRQAGQVVGSMVFYAPTPHFFTPSIMQTLEEMSSEIGFALEAIGTRAELEEQRHLMRSIIDANEAIVYAFDLDGRALILNAATGKMFQSDHVLSIGKRREEFMLGDLAAAAQHRAHDLLVIEFGNPLVIEETYADRIFLSVKYPLRDLSGKLYAVGGVSTDITDIRRLQHEIEEANRGLEAKVTERTSELRAAKEMAESADRAKSAFLATMSHELRSPLNSIIGFTSILLEGLTGPLNDAQRKQLQIVNDSSRHLLAIISDLLDISRIEAGVLEISSRPFPVQPVIARVLERFALQAKQKGIEFGQSPGPCTESVNADERRVEQIIANLVSNAVKFTDAGSVQIHVTTSDGEMRVAVRDTGPGIAASDQGRLFHHFSQLKPRDGKLREGTGLGLAISDRLARAMGGRVELDSEVGIGSTFTMVLPWEFDPGL